jgi:hypothetical protein
VLKYKEVDAMSDTAELRRLAENFQIAIDLFLAERTTERSEAKNKAHGDLYSRFPLPTIIALLDRADAAEAQCAAMRQMLIELYQAIDFMKTPKMNGKERIDCHEWTRKIAKLLREVKPV